MSLLPVLDAPARGPHPGAGPVDDGSPWTGPLGQRMERLELHLTYHCPERCVFCSEAHRMAQFSPFPVTFSRVAQVLRTHAGQGVRAVHLTGGEPTIHPRFLDVLRLARGLGLRTSIGTIGTRLAEPEFAAEVMPWLDETLFSIHGPDDAVHDALTGRDGSFRKVCRAVDNCRAARPGFRPFVNHVLTRANAARLTETVDVVRHRLGASLLIVSNVTPEGGGADRYGDLAVPLARLPALAESAVAAAGDALMVRFFGIPLCALGTAAMHANDLHWAPRVTVEWARHPDRVALEGVWSWTPERKRVRGPPCARCRYQGVCYGVFAEYAARHGWGEVTPLEPDP